MEQYYTTNHKRTNNGVHNAKKEKQTVLANSFRKRVSRMTAGLCTIYMGKPVGSRFGN